MKYSIIVPVLNEEKIILNLLKQLSNPELKSRFGYEVIISDGGSSDDTIIKALPLSDKIISHCTSEYQKISVGRNMGASAASGEILIFITADILFRNFEEFLSAVENDFSRSDYAAFTCDVVINPEEEIFADKLFIGFYRRYFKFLNTLGIGMARGECQVLRKSLFMELGGYNPGITAGEDFEFFTRVRKKGKILCSDKCLVYESPRRYRKYGHLAIFFSWLVNSISVLLLGKSASKTWKAVR